jgi:hypothetical protein
MKEQTKPSIKAHLIPSLFILLSIITICVMPFAQAQRDTKKQDAQGASKATIAGPGAAATKLSAPKPVITGSTARVFRMGTPPAPAAPQVVLYSQYDNPGANATLSATFTDFPTFSVDLADDFTIPAGQTWGIQSIDADGAYFNGAGPANSWNVYVYANAGGVPGAVLFSALNQPVTVSGTTYTVNVTFCPIPAGTYWVEVQANMTFSPFGEWGWTDRTVQNGAPAQWQDPGGGFGVCPTWMPKLATCVTTASGPDQVFRINGVLNPVVCPTPAPTPTTTPTPTATATPTPICNGFKCIGYTAYTIINETVVPGTTDTGNHCDNCSTAITFPFPVSLYGATYDGASLSSNGTVDLVGTSAIATTGCVTLPSNNWATAILAYQGDLRTDTGLSGCTTWANGCGIFTSVTGTAPSRVFHITWQAVSFADNANTANFEVRFFENNCVGFEVFYGTTFDNGLNETSGVQGFGATTFSCGTAALTNGLGVAYTCMSGTPTPTPIPCGVWNFANSYPITNARYGFAQTGQYFYVFGGVSNGTRMNSVNMYNFFTRAWTALAPMPFTSEAPTCALMASTGLVYCAEGDTGTGFASYSIASNTWTSRANVPNAAGNDYGSASGAFNGKVFVVGGTTNFSSNVYVYDVATNTWAAGTAAPDPFLLAGYQQVGQYLYLAGGWTGGTSTGLTTTRRLDMSSAPGVWSNGPAFPMGRADFGLAYDPGTDKLYSLGGDNQGGGFFDSTDEVDELDISGWPAGTWNLSPPFLPAPNRQANQAGFNGNGAIWSTGGIDGTTSTFLADHRYRINVCGPTVLSVVSRVIHSGGCGTFDNDVLAECRSTGGNYMLVVRFSDNETVTSASVTCHNPASGTGTTGAVSGSGTPVITIPLTGVSNAQTLTVHINGTTSVDIPFILLIGDTNNNGTVNAADIAQTKGRLGQTVTAANFRSDVNANCSINAADVAIIKQHSGVSVVEHCP